MIRTEQNYEEFFSNYDSSYLLFFESFWQSYEECGWIFIFWKNKEFYKIEGGHSVLAEENKKPDFLFDLEKISDNDVLSLIEEWDELERVVH